MDPGRPLRVALVEDVELVVQGLARMVEPYADRVEVVAHADDGVISDITLVDVRSGPGGTAGIAAAQGAPQPGQVVVWTWDLDPRLVRESLDHGVSGYLAKTLPATELVVALERIHAGERVVSDRPPAAPQDPEDWPGRDQGLTVRESQIIQLITHGLSNQQIADRAYLSINSVKSYIRASYRKMGVTSRSRAVLWGIEHGFRDAGDLGDREA